MSNQEKTAESTRQATSSPHVDDATSLKGKITPTPWSMNDWPQKDGEIRIGAKGIPLIATVHLRDASINQQKANAAFIVQAVNSHDELVEMLKESIHLLERTPLERQGSSMEIRISKTVARAQAALNNVKE